MAKLEAPTGGSGIQIADLAPPAQHVAVCIRITDLFDVDRPSFQNPQQMEKRDVTRFIFGLVGQDGKLYLVQTFEFTISGAPGANLSKFLKAWLGRDAEMGWDYCELLGCGALVTVQHAQSRRNPGQYYAAIAGIAPVHPELVHLIPQPEIFEPLLTAAMANAGPPQVAPAVAQPPPRQPPYQPPRQPPPASAARPPMQPPPGVRPPPAAPARAPMGLPPRAGAPAAPGYPPPGAPGYPPPGRPATGAPLPVEDDSVPF